MSLRSTIQHRCLWGGQGINGTLVQVLLTVGLMVISAFQSACLRLIHNWNTLQLAETPSFPLLASPPNNRTYIMEHSLPLTSFQENKTRR